MEVKIYTRRTPVCDYCNQAKQLLRDAGIAYEEIDISKPGFDKEALKAQSGMTTVPIIYFDGKLIGGKDQLEKLDLEKISKMKYSEAKIRPMLRGDVCEVTFIKVDGSERIMRCTLNPRLIPVDKKPKEDDKDDSQFETINTIVKVYDIDVAGWRSVDLTRVLSVELLT